jgi:primosomal protein N' (replication factor Y)
MLPAATIVRVAVPSPLPRLFDYLCPAVVAAGSRVRVPFGRSRQVGIVVEVGADSELERSRLRPVEAVLDEAPLLAQEPLQFALWASRYYHHPPGEALAAAIPSLLRQGAPAVPAQDEFWVATQAAAGANLEALERRARRQAAMLRRLLGAAGGVSADRLREDAEGWREVMRALEAKGWAQSRHDDAFGLVQGKRAGSAPALNPHQQAACDAVRAEAGFGCFLLDGVTGSGKTEVYLELIERCLQAGKQALVLVPEIGLTPQLIERFAARFDAAMAVFHSGLSDRERLNAWLAARGGAARIVIATRSGVFTPLKALGLIVVDEEHDLSFKQQDGFRYHARDLAVARASRLGIPVVLGSATPSLESLYNVARRGYVHLKLPQRAGSAAMPSLQILDIRGKPLAGGLCQALLARMRQHLEQDGQVLIFLNRRGFAPTLLCHDCAWVSTCDRCDARLTLHARALRLRCHHCGHERAIPDVCPSCRSEELRPVGQGTERVEREISARFPGVGLVRIDRDSTRRKGAMQALLRSAHSGEGRILIGTQMLAKGHHLPNVTLVGIIDADSGLFSADFRATERLAQLIVQVAGRAGRAERRGEVIIQTHQPDHPLLHTLLGEGYGPFAQTLLSERRQVSLPPYASLALLRAEAVDANAPLVFLEDARAQAEALGLREVQLLGPIPAPMERRAGRFRAQLLLQAARRQDLQRLLTAWAVGLNGVKSARRVRWSIDVDPMELI